MAQYPGVWVEDFRSVLQQINRFPTQKARPSFQGQAGLAPIDPSSRPFPTIIIGSFLIGVEQARHQGANHPEAGTTLQRETDRGKRSSSGLVSVLFLASARGYDSRSVKSARQFLRWGNTAPGGKGRCSRIATALFFNGSAPAKALVVEMSLAGPGSGDARR